MILSRPVSCKLILSGSAPTRASFLRVTNHTSSFVASRSRRGCYPFLTRGSSTANTSTTAASRRSALPKNNRTKATLAATSSSTAARRPQRWWWDRCQQFLYKPRTVPIPRWITPRHSQITATECFGHVSFGLVAISYAVDDFLLLRMIAVVGSTSMLVFTYFHPHGRVLWLPFKWNMLFIAINCYRIGKVFWTQYLAEQLPQELKDHREKNFYLMDPVDYYRLMSIAEIKEYRKGDLVLSQGEVVPCVRMVLSGQLRVLRDGELTYMLDEDNFISEAGIHVGLLIPGGIESCCAVQADSDNGEVTRVLCWDRTELVHLMQVHGGLRRSLKAIMSWDIVRKLKAQRSLLHHIDDPDQWTDRRQQQTHHRYAAIVHAIFQLHVVGAAMSEQFRKDLAKYRMVHQIDDALHKTALEDCGWTVEEYEAGKVPATHLLSLEDDDEDDDERMVHLMHRATRSWEWWARDVYLRLFG